MVRSRFIVHASILAAVSTLPLTASAQTCNSLQGAANTALISYLGNMIQNRSNAACVAVAIQQLGGQRVQSAAPLLTNFLDFRWPTAAHQKQRLYVLEHDGRSIYPAADALEQIGSPALPAVLAAIEANNNLSGESMEVAVSVWMTLHKAQAPIGIALLQRETRKAGLSVAAKQRLLFAAYIAARDWCAPNDRAQCRKVASSK